MTCPKYEGDRRYGFKSEFYHLSSEHIKNHCTASFESCSTYVSGLEEKARDEENILKTLTSNSKPISEPYF